LPYDLRNSSVFSARLNAPSDGSDVIAGGSAFQTFTAASGKAVTYDTCLSALIVSFDNYYSNVEHFSPNWCKEYLTESKFQTPASPEIKSEQFD